MLIHHISDTHNQQEEIEIPSCDLLIHSGDLTMSGGVEKTWKALQWLDRLPIKHKILVPGNHDRCFEDKGTVARAKQEFPSLHILVDEQVEIEGVLFYGAPHTPNLPRWAFHFWDEAGDSLWERIPLETQVLITHGPPYGILDKVERYLDVGSRSLLRRLHHLASLRLHCFGHIHEEGGKTITQGEVTFSNGASMDERYELSPQTGNTITLETNGLPTHQQSV